MSAIAPPLTDLAWKALEAHYQTKPGDWVGAAKSAGVDRRTAKRAWVGPSWKSGECANRPPLRESFANTEAGLRQRQAEQEAASRAEQLDQLEKAKKLQEEAAQMDANIMRAARIGVMGGLRSLVQLQSGVEQLASRVADELKRGTDAKGNPLDIDALKALRIIAHFSTSSKQLTDAATVLANLERVRQNLPTAILGLEVSNLTIEDAEREVEIATHAIKQAKEWGVLKAVPGGKK